MSVMLCTGPTFVKKNSCLVASIDGSRTAATSKMGHFLITVNGFQPLTTITKCSILDVAAVLDPPLARIVSFYSVGVHLLTFFILEPLSSRYVLTLMML